MLYEELSYQIRGAIFKIHKESGPFHKESIYSNALETELKKMTIPFKKELLINVVYQSKKVGVYRPDFLIDNKIILELKATEFLPRQDERQIFYYLKESPFRLGFLINFGSRNGVDIRGRIVR